MAENRGRSTGSSSAVPTTGEPRGIEPPATDLRIYLSGGGVRATLANAGALWWIRKRFPESTVSAMVSVSGGSLTSTALMLADPSGDNATVEATVKRLYDQTHLGNLRNIAALIALAGVPATVLVTNAFTPARLAEYWWVFAVFLTLWTVCLWVTRVMFVPLAVATAAFAVAEVDVQPIVERQVCAFVLCAATWVAMGIVIGRSWLNRIKQSPGAPLRFFGRILVTVLILAAAVGTSLTFGTWRSAVVVTGAAVSVTIGYLAWWARRVIPPVSDRSPLDHRPTNGWNLIHSPFVSVAIAHAVAALLLTGWSFWPVPALSHAVILMVGWSSVSLLTGPTLLQRYLGRVVGLSDDWTTLSKILQPSAAMDSRPTRPTKQWVQTYVICTSDLRDEVPAYFIVGEGLTPTMFSVAQHDDASPHPTADASEVRVSTTLQASASAITVFGPTVGFGLRRLHNATPPASFPLFLDGGLQGTLGTQFESGLGAAIESLLPVNHLQTPGVAMPRHSGMESADHTLTTPDAASAAPPKFRFVVDATKRRSTFRTWWAMLVPKFGGDVIQLRMTQSTLSALVESQRLDMKYADPGADGYDATYFAQVTGAEAGFNDSASDQRYAPFDALLQELRRRADRARFWFPFPSTARNCLAAGIVAAIEATEGSTDESLERALTELIALQQRVGRVKDLGVPVTVPNVAALDAGGGSRLRANASGRARCAMATAFVLGLWWYPVAKLTSGGDPGCRPVCTDRSDGARHPFFGDGKTFIAVSHEGLKSDGKITKDGFLAARALGYTYFETDIGLAPGSSSQLIAIHKRPRASEDDMRQLEPPLLEDILKDPTMAGTHWNLEINHDDNDEAAVLTELNTLIETYSPNPMDKSAETGNGIQFCIHFGNERDQSHVEAAREALPAGTCTCASVLERLRVSDLPPVRAAALFRTFRSEIPDGVDCAMVSDTTADARDISDGGKGVMIMSWPSAENPETEEGIRKLIEDGFGGMMTNDPELLKRVLEDVGRWPQPPNS